MEPICPWCGGELPGEPGQFVKCRHCRSDVFWGGGTPWKTMKEAVAADLPALRSKPFDKWDRMFQDICREIVCRSPNVDAPENGKFLDIGWQRDAYFAVQKGVLHDQAEPVDGDVVMPWDVDLGEFMEDLEEDPDAATVLGDGEEFNLGIGTLGENDASASVNVASELVGDSDVRPASMTDSLFVGESVGVEGQLAEPGNSMSLSQLGMYIGGLPDTTFSAFQVAVLVCCSILMLFGGLLAFDLVRTIGTASQIGWPR